MPGMLIGMAIVAMIWGGAVSLGGCFQLLTAIRFLSVGGPDATKIRIYASADMGLSAFLGIAALTVAGGGVLRLMRKALGRNLAVYGSLGILVMQVIKLAALLIVTEKFGPYQMGNVAGLLMIFGIFSFFYSTQQNEAVNRVLR